MRTEMPTFVLVAFLIAALVYLGVAFWSIAGAASAEMESRREVESWADDQDG